MNKKSLLLALLTASTPLIAAEKPSQVLESLMQPLPSVAANIQARAAAYPALRHIPSSASAFIVMADVQGNITKLLNSKLIMEASEGESAKSIASIPPIESIAIALEQGSEANIFALLQLKNNLSALASNIEFLNDWQSSSLKVYRGSFSDMIKNLQDSNAKDIFKGVNKADINYPEFRIITTMKPGSEALVVELKQQFDAQLAELNKMIPMPLIQQDGYSIIALPLATALAMIPEFPTENLDAMINSQHYLAVKFEGNCISVIYSRDLKKINAASSMEQSMLASDKLKLSDARLKQGIVGTSFVNAALINMAINIEQDIPYIALIENIFLSLNKINANRCFKEAAHATAKVSKQINDLKKNFSKQIKIGDYANVLWGCGNLNYTEVCDYAQSTWNYKTGQVNAWNQIDKAETISYLSISPIKSAKISSPDFDCKAFVEDLTIIGKGINLTLREDEYKELNSSIEKIKIAIKGLSNIYKGTEGTITLYADNKKNDEDICKSSCLTEIFSDFFTEGKAPRLTIFRAVGDKLKLDDGIRAMWRLCPEGGKKGEYFRNYDKFVSFGNSSALNQSIRSELSQSSSSKQFAGVIFYFNGQAMLPLIKHKDEDSKELLELMPQIHAVAYPNDGKLILRALLK